MSGKIYIDLHPCGSFSSGMFWGDAQRYASTTPDGVTSYFAEAPNVATEEIPHQLRVWRSHQADGQGDFNQWAAFCIQKWGVWFERVNSEKRRARIGRPAITVRANGACRDKMIRIITGGEVTEGILRNKCREIGAAQFTSVLDSLVADGLLAITIRANQTNGRPVTTYSIRGV